MNNILRLLEGAYTDDRLNRVEILEILRIISPLISKLTKIFKVVGSYRRDKGKNDYGDLDIIAANTSTLDVFNAILKKIPGTTIGRRGDKVLTMVVPFKSKLAQVEVNIVDSTSLGAATLHSVGSQNFNIGLRSLAKSKGFTLNQYGLFDNNSVKIAGDTEESVFTKLGLRLIPYSDRSLNSVSEFYSLIGKYTLFQESPNKDIVDGLRSIAKTKDSFRSMAYYKAAKTIEQMPTKLTKDTLDGIPGVGPSIKASILQLL